MTGDTRPDLPIPLSAAALRSYMRATGWHEGPHGTAGSLWSKNAAGFAVPHDDGEFTLRGVIARLAAAEGRTLEETAAVVAAHKAARLAMPADEFAAVKTVAETCGPTITAGAPEVTSPAPAPGERPGTTTGPADGAEAALGRVAKLAESWAALAIPGASGDVAAEVDAHCGRVLLDVIHGSSNADVRLSRVTAVAEPWLAPGGPGLFYPAAGQAVLDAIRGASTEEAGDWRGRAEAAEARLVAIEHLCREPSHVLLKGTDAGIEGTDYVRADAILAIISTEGEDGNG